MNFTPKINVRPVVYGTLTVAVVGLMVWISHIAPALTPFGVTHDTLTVPEVTQTRLAVPVVPAVLLTPAPGLVSLRKANQDLIG
jgi:hypothetical protein